MSTPPIRPTQELTQQIAGAIHSGGYPYVAAEAYGISKEVFDDWLKRGSQKNAWEPFRSFAREVRAAFALARLRAESAEFTKNPRLWLVHGPGRESEQRPGWSTSVKPTVTTPEEHNALLDPELMALLRAVLTALEGFPEARAHVAQVLSQRGMDLDNRTQGQEEKENDHGATSV